MNRVFRLRKTLLYEGIGCIAFSLVMFVACGSIFFLEDPARHGFHGEHSVALVGGMGCAVFGGMSLIGVYLCVAYFLERFTIDAPRVAVRSVFQNREFDTPKIERLEWRTRPAGGSVLFRLRNSAAKVRLELFGYREADRLGIIRALADLVPRGVQEGWPVFCQHIALPLRDGPASIALHQPSARTCKISRRRYDRLLAIVLPLAVGVSFALRSWLDWRQFLTLPIVVVGFWLLLRFHLPRDGSVELELASTADGRGTLILLGAAFGSLLIMVGLELLGTGAEIAVSTGCVVILLAAAPAAYYFIKAGKEHRAADRAGKESALNDWQRGEGTLTNVAAGKKDCG